MCCFRLLNDSDISFFSQEIGHIRNLDRFFCDGDMRPFLRIDQYEKKSATLHSKIADDIFLYKACLLCRSCSALQRLEGFFHRRKKPLFVQFVFKIGFEFHHTGIKTIFVH